MKLLGGRSACLLVVLASQTTLVYRSAFTTTSSFHLIAIRIHILDFPHTGANQACHYKNSSELYPSRQIRNRILLILAARLGCCEANSCPVEATCLSNFH